ncbi:hypothetical protein [Halorubrum sp. BV1]|uniref:DUF7563 family protein n=1 Tax=Halorubrum sp. BV1 TaxID=1498500 RepID=UPI0006794342|nr:hypothetical protein [Halorubrum sp. BV1]
MIRLQRGSTDERECHFCGCHVTDTFARVHGDQDDTVHRCLGCDCFRRVSRGSAAGVSVDLPDPAEQPNRNRGQRVGAALRTDGGEFDGD